MNTIYRDFFAKYRVLATRSRGPSAPLDGPLSRYPGPRGVTPAFGYGTPDPGAGGTSTDLIWALPRTHCRPLRHPIAPSLTVTGLKLVATTDHAIGLPVLRTCHLGACYRHDPGAATGCLFRSLPQPNQPSPHGRPGQPAQPFKKCETAMGEIFSLSFGDKGAGRAVVRR